MSSHVYYFDYAAATPIDRAVIEAMKPYLTDKFYNPSAQYLAAKEVAQNIDTSRRQLADVLGIRSSEVIFTAGGTESNNLAVQGILKQFPEGRVVLSAIEHDSVRKPAQQYSYNEAKVDYSGILDLDSVKESITEKTVLVSVMTANNEIGTIQPIKEVSELIKKVRNHRVASGNSLPIYLHTDASQAGNYLRLQPKTMGVDMMTINGGKLYGPKQTGMLFVRSGVVIKPIVLGGGQELGLRNGTENVAGIVGFCQAVTIAQSKHNEERNRLKDLQEYFINSLGEKLPSANINGHRQRRLPNNVHITIPGKDNERLMMILDEKGIQVAVGSACSASHDEPSHVLKAIGLSDQDARASLRFSMGRSTTKDVIDYAITQLVSACKVLT